MNRKTLIRNILLVFALGSVAFMAIREMADRRAATGPASMSAAELTPSTALVVYYFSEGKECTTCEQIPLAARATLDAYFADQLRSGEIVWCAVDVDEARNAHYIDEYHIYTKSIVLSRIKNGTQSRWKNLDKIWDAVYDRTALMNYLRSEIRAELDAPA